MNDPTARLLHALGRVERLVADGDVQLGFAVKQIATLCRVDGVELALLFERKARAREAARAALAGDPDGDDE